MTMWGRGGVPFLSEMVVRFEISKASPNASNPGPRLAVVPGTETVTERDASDFAFEAFFLTLMFRDYSHNWKQVQHSAVAC
jgi:hypothetical protein